MKKYKKAYVEITNVCNKDCSFCHGTKRAPRHMAKNEFERVLDELKGVTEYLYLHVLGEPLCHPDIHSFINIAEKRGYKITLTTNGTLLDYSLLNSSLHKIQISLHSFEDEDEAGHKEYLENIIHLSKAFAEKGTLISLRLWNLSSNVSNDFAEKVLKKAFPNEWKKGRDNSYTLDKNIFLHYAQRFEWPDKNEEDNGDELFCYGLRDQIAVLSNGTVVPCCLDAEGEIALGNIYTTPLTQILSSPRATAIYDGFSKRRATEELCRKCKYAKRFD